MSSLSQPLARDLVIVGGGPAGLAGALAAARGLLTTTVLERGAAGGELLNTHQIENALGFGTVEGPALAARFADHARAAGAELREFAPVAALAPDPDRPGWFLTTTDDGTCYRSPAVLVTAGGTPAKLGIPGELAYAGQGVSYCGVCDSFAARGRHIVCVGGSDTAVEEAVFLAGFADRVTVVHRGGSFRAARVLQERLFAHPKIDVRWHTVAEEVVGDATGMTGLRVRDTRTGAGVMLPVTACFVFIGHRPNTGVLAGLDAHGLHVAHDAGGYLVTDGTMQTTVPGLYAAGDMRVQYVRQVCTAIADGSVAGIAIERQLAARGVLPLAHATAHATALAGALAA